MCHGQKIPIQTDEGDPHPAAGVRVHPYDRVQRGNHPEGTRREVAPVRLFDFVPLEGFPPREGHPVCPAAATVRDQQPAHAVRYTGSKDRFGFLLLLVFLIEVAFRPRRVRHF